MLSTHHEITTSNIEFPDTLNHCHIVKSLGGGTHSVFLIEETTTQRQYVLKFAAHPAACKIEILWNAIYHALGVPVPSIHVYYHISEQIRKHTQLDSCDGYFQVAEFVTVDAIDSLQTTIAQAKLDFIIYALLGNTDIKPANFIGDKLIDAGSNFMYRGLGETRYDLSQTLSELWRLKDEKINPIGCEWFQTLDYHAMREKALALLNKAHLIERTIREKAPLLGISDSLQTIILDKISERLETLIRYFFANDNPKAQTIIQVNKETMGAGILTYKNINGTLHVLLSKRARHEWWGIFGGKCEEGDDDLSDTARRETHEESSGLLAYSKQAIATSSSHDLITIYQDGHYFLYRMYFLQDPGIDIEKINDTEHTAHCYVSMQDLLASSFDKNTETSQVKSNGKTFILFPPFYHMLQQTAVQRYLTDLINGKALRQQQSHSVIRIGVTQNAAPINVKVYNHIASSPVIYQQKTQTLLNHSHLLKEFKAIYKKDAGRATNSPQKLSPSDKHLQLILGGEYADNNHVKNINTIFKKNRSFVQADLKQQRHLCNTASRFIKNEQENHGGHYFLYHGCNDITAFLYTFYTQLYHYLYGNNANVVFRINNQFLSRFEIIAQFISFYSNQQKEIDSNISYFNENCLSTNAFLFGNYDVPTSYSFQYFINNYVTTPINIETILSELLLPLHISKELINRLIAVYHQYFAHFGGALYQIKIGKDGIDHVTYAAASGNALHRRNGSFQLSKILDDFIGSDLNQIDIETSNYYKKLQVRLVLTAVQSFASECVYWHEPSHDKKRLALTQLNKITEEIVRGILKNQTSTTSKLNDPLIRIHSLFCNANNNVGRILSADEMIHDQLCSAIYKNNPTEFKSILGNNTTLTQLEKAKPYLKQIVWMFIFKNDSVTFKDIEKIFGQTWWYHCEFKEYINVQCFINKIANAESFYMMRDVIVYAIRELGKWHSQYLRFNVSTYLLQLVTKIYQDQYEVYSTLVYIEKELKDSGRSQEFIKSAIGYTVQRLHHNLSDEILTKVLTDLCSWNFLMVFIDFCLQAIKTEQHQRIMYDILFDYLKSKETKSDITISLYLDELMELVDKVPIPADYKNTIYHALVKLEIISIEHFTSALTLNPDIFYQTNQFGVTTFEMMVKLISSRNSLKDEESNFLNKLLQRLIELNNKHPVYKKILFNHQLKMDDTIFNCLFNTYTSDEKVILIQEAGNGWQIEAHDHNGKVMLIQLVGSGLQLEMLDHIDKHDLNNNLLCQTLLIHFSLIKLFVCFDADEFLTIIRSSTQQADMMQFLTILKQIIENDLLYLDPHHYKELAKLDLDVSIQEQPIKNEVDVPVLLQQLRESQLKFCKANPADNFAFPELGFYGIDYYEPNGVRQRSINAVNKIIDAMMNKMELKNSITA